MSYYIVMHIAGIVPAQCALRGCFRQGHALHDVLQSKANVRHSLMQKFQKLAEQLPWSKHVHSKLICAITWDLMNEHPKAKTGRSSTAMQGDRSAAKTC